ncbi:MAG: BglG family transcription antiterminator [Eubacteriales bacterium]
MMTTRLKQILEVLLRSGGTLSVKQLSEEIGLSKRTVQRELELMDKALKPYGLQFVSKAGVGVWLEGDEDGKARLSTEILSGDLYDSGNKDERRKRLILELLREKGLKKLFVFSHQFGVSEATISVDLEFAERWLSTYDLRIVRKPGSGVYVAGQEEDFRRAICGFLYDHLSANMVEEAYQAPTNHGYAVIQRSGIAKMLENNIIERVVACLTACHGAYISTLTEQTYIRLVLHLAISIKRITKDMTISPNSQWLQDIAEDRDYELAEDMACSLEDAFGMEIPDTEVAYLCLHIKGAKHQQIYQQNPELFGENREILQQLLNEMIYAYDPKAAYLFKQDEEFIQGLLSHLQPTIIRIKYNLEIHNPMLEAIQQNYAPIYQRCLDVASVLEKRLGKTVPPDEIGFLTVHFGAALVRAEGKKEQMRPVKIAVVCSSGIGISRLMSSKLHKIFKERVILSAYGKRDMTPETQKSVDFCVSSLPLKGVEIPVAEVSALLSDQDLEEISRLIAQFERTATENLPAINFAGEMEQVQQVASGIQAILQNFALHQADSAIPFGALIDQIATQLTDTPEKQAVLSAQFWVRERVATQVFGELGFALIHTRSEAVTAPVFQVWRADVPFQDSHFQNITLAFTMVVPAGEQGNLHSNLLGHISSALVEDDRLLETAKQGNEPALSNLLAHHLKQYFQQYLSKFIDNE